MYRGLWEQRKARIGHWWGGISTEQQVTFQQGEDELEKNAVSVNTQPSHLKQ